MSKDDIDKRVQEAADILGLTEFLHRKPKALSGGQRQRVAMGRAIVRSPRAFLMDEPLSNLDAKLRVQMRAEIAQLQSRLGVTTLYVTHDQVEAMTMGDRVAVLRGGELMQAANPQELYDHPNNLFVAGFIGSPSMNIAEAHLDKTADGQPQVTVGDFTIPLPDEALENYPDVRDYYGQRIAVGMRPEHFVRADQEEVPEGQRFRVEASIVELLGSEILVHFHTSARPVISEDMKSAIDDEDAFAELERSADKGSNFTARFDPTNAPKAGDAIEIGFQTKRMHFFDYDSGRALR